MSEQKHTPGPWYWRIAGRFGTVEAEGGARSGGNVGVCILEHERPDQVAAMEANACLIAAAPDLLAALKGIIDQACVNGCLEFNHADGEGSCVVHSEACEAARAAIAKAERGAP